MYIIDASVYAPLIITYGKDLIEKLRKIRPIILDLTLYEICNAFWKEHIKLHKISKEEAIIACSASKALSRYITLYSIIDLDIDKVMKMAIENDITFYDASYIALAHKLKTSIASEDHDIITVAPKYNIRVIRLNELINILEQT